MEGRGPLLARPIRLQALSRHKIQPRSRHPRRIKADSLPGFDQLEQAGTRQRIGEFVEGKVAEKASIFRNAFALAFFERHVENALRVQSSRKPVQHARYFCMWHMQNGSGSPNAVEFLVKGHVLKSHHASI